MSPPGWLLLKEKKSSINVQHELIQLLSFPPAQLTKSVMSYIPILPVSEEGSESVKVLILLCAYASHLGLSLRPPFITCACKSAADERE